MKAVLLLLVLTVSASASKVTPVAKVIEMLHGMLETSKSEKAQETETYTKFAGWCHDVDMTKSRDISDGNAKIDGLVADIAKFESDIARLTTEIEAIDGDVAAWTGDKDE